MTKHAAGLMLGRLYMTDVINTAKLMRLTGMLESEKSCDKAIKKIEKLSEKIKQL